MTSIHHVDTDLSAQVQRLLSSGVLKAESGTQFGPFEPELVAGLIGIFQHQQFGTLSPEVRTRLMDFGKTLQQSTTLPIHISRDLNAALVSAMSSASPRTVRLDAVGEAPSTAAAKDADSGRASHTFDSSLMSRTPSPSSLSEGRNSVFASPESVSTPDSGRSSASDIAPARLSSPTSVSPTSASPSSPAPVMGGDMATMPYLAQARKTAHLVTNAVFGGADSSANMVNLHQLLHERANQAGRDPDTVDALFDTQAAAQAAMFRASLLLLTEDPHGGCATRVSSVANGAKEGGLPSTLPLATLIGHGGRQIFAFESNATMQGVLNYILAGELGTEAKRPRHASDPQKVATGEASFNVPESAAPSRGFSSHQTTGTGKEKALGGKSKFAQVKDFGKIYAPGSKRHIRFCPYLGMTARQVADHMGLDWEQVRVPADAVFGPPGTLYHMSGPNAGTPVQIDGKVVSLGEMYIELTPRDEKHGKPKDPKALASFTIGYESVPPGAVLGVHYTDMTGKKIHDSSSTTETAAKDRSAFGGCKSSKLGRCGLDPSRIPSSLGGVWVEPPADAVRQVRRAEAAFTGMLADPAKHDALSATVDRLFTAPVVSYDGTPTGLAAMRDLVTTGSPPADILASSRPVRPVPTRPAPRPPVVPAATLVPTLIEVDPAD